MDDAFSSARALLAARGAGQVAHPGGDLLSHLVRAGERLRGWGARPALTLAGLTHAAYGTDGLPVALLDLDERDQLAAVIGDEADNLVYLYASCDRGHLNPQLADRGPMILRDRFTGTTRPLTAPEQRDLLELTFANELDLVAHSPAFAATEGEAIADMFRSCRQLVSPAAWHDFTQLLGVSSA